MRIIFYMEASSSGVGGTLRVDYIHFLFSSLGVFVASLSLSVSVFVVSLMILFIK